MRGRQRLFSTLGGLLLGVHALMAQAASPEAAAVRDARWSLEAGAESFRWRENDDDGQRLLTEQGPRFIYGATLGNFSHAEAGMIFEMRLAGLLGEVDYDGQDSNGRFVGTVTDYSGWSGEVGGGYRFADVVRGVSIDLFGGLGLDDWRREINGGVNSIGQTVAGFTEEYDVDYFRYGIGILLRDASPGGYLQVGFRRPRSVGEQVRIQGQAVNLSPGEQASAFLSYRIALGNPRAAGASGSFLRFYYTGYRLGKSQVEDIGSGLVWQPRSSLDALGITLGYFY